MGCGCCERSNRAIRRKKSSIAVENGVASITIKDECCGGFKARSMESFTTGDHSVEISLTSGKVIKLSGIDNCDIFNMVTTLNFILSNY